MTTAPEATAPTIEASTTDSSGSRSTGPDATTPDPQAPHTDPKAEELSISLLGAIDAWLLSLRAAIARAADIAVLEARLAALNFVLIIIVAVASGLFLAMGWIALFAAMAAWFHELGLSWSAALLLMAAINIGFAAAGGYAIYRMSNNLMFKAVRKFITYSQQVKRGEDNVPSGPAAGNTPPAP